MNGTTSTARLLLSLLVTATLVICCGCGRRAAVIAPPVEGTSTATGITVEVPAGPVLTPELKAEGWTTNSDFPPEGSSQARKGGTIRFWAGNFPTTVRPFGKDHNLVINLDIRDSTHECLLKMHFDTLEYTPKLASHWQILPDKMTYRFKINPKARWADGRPVTAEDVIATYDLLMDPGLLFPLHQVEMGAFERPRALAPDVVEVKSKTLNWRNFVIFATEMYVLPAHVIKGMDGARFLREFQYKPILGSGPYHFTEADVKKGESITLHRRADYWGWGERSAFGLYNFDGIRFVCGTESTLGYEKAKKGEVDLFVIDSAKAWAEEVPKLPAVERGLLQRRFIHNDKPAGFSGIALNMRRPPLDDLRVRKALAYAFNREEMLAKLMYNQYTPTHAYHSGDWANPDNERVKFDPARAQQLLAEAGWKERDAEGYLVRDGKRLELELAYWIDRSLPGLTIYQEDLRRLGVKLELKHVTLAALFPALTGDRNFQMAEMGWGGLRYMNPEAEWSSELADQKDTNNITGFKDVRVDELCKAYDKAFDLAEQVKIVREIDGRIFRQHPYVLDWGSTFSRLLYWNKFGHPESYLNRTTYPDALLWSWWVDPEKERQLRAAEKDSSVKLEVGPTEVRYWLDKRQAAATSGTAGTR